MEALTIRPAQPADLPAIRALFRDTVLRICRRDYLPAQTEAWAQSADEPDLWVHRLESQHFLLALVGGEPAGFASLTPGGYIDLLYVHADRQGQGTASALMDALMALAQRLGLQVLSADVSITARPFFGRRGFGVVSANRKLLRGQTFLNYRMERRL
ncbi:MAG: GNAT family N-acetyltransferase [Bacteroidia bacterium]|nr:GNAT family N-acetyltransferase [Bacteroidia bacterium]